MNLKIRSLYNALGATIYITVVALLLQNASKWFGNKPDTIMAPIAFLMVFVLSATIVGALVIGKPVIMYLNDRKPEAIKLFLYTVGWMALATVIVFLANFIR